MKIACLLIVSVTVLIGLSCNKQSQQDPPPQVDVSPCVVTGSPSYFGTTQTFTYDQKDQLTIRTYEFNYPGYGPFTQTVDAIKMVSGYTHNGNKLQSTDIFQGGTGNLYDGTPAMMIRHEMHTNSAGTTIFDGGLDTLLTFGYDEKKRLIKTVYHPALLEDDVVIIYSRQLYAIVIDITYDENDNATKLKQTRVYRQGIYNVNNPSASYFTYAEEVDMAINVTYDDKPSPYSAILKYWKFVQNDWGVAVNSNWQAIITALSKNNPLTVAYETYHGTASNIKNTMVYNYNAQGFPTDGYTYRCK